MSKEELLKRLAPGSMSFEPRIDGGNPEQIAELVAGALAFGHISEASSIYCRIKYCLDNDPRSRSRLERLMLIKLVVTIVARGGWKQVKTEFMPRLITVSLDECLSESVCRTCSGRGFIIVEDRQTPCEPCGSSGRKSFSNREVSRRLGLCHRNFGRRYDSKYRQVLGLYYDLEHEACSALSKIGN